MTEKQIKGICAMGGRHSQRKFYLWWGMRPVAGKLACSACACASRSGSCVASPHVRTSQRWNSTECMRAPSSVTARRPVGGCGRQWSVCFRPVIHVPQSVLSRAVPVPRARLCWLPGFLAREQGLDKRCRLIAGHVFLSACRVEPHNAPLHR